MHHDQNAERPGFPLLLSFMSFLPSNRSLYAQKHAALTPTVLNWSSKTYFLENICRLWWSHCWTCDYPWC